MTLITFHSPVSLHWCIFQPQALNQFIDQQINFNTRMDAKDSDQSQNQGFHVNQPSIAAQNLCTPPLLQKKDRQFQPRYMAGYGMIRKEPKECHDVVDDIPNRGQSFNYLPVDVRANKEEDLPSVSEKYLRTSEYTLLYSRNKEPFGSEYRCAFSNEVSLKSCEHYKDDNFKPLKDFDYKTTNQENFPTNHLIFDSRFQSGNLQCAFLDKNTPNHYTLFMQNDTNTYGYNQWFYFSVRNARKNTKYTFEIANYRKQYSFFKLGMKPLVFSLKTAKQQGNGWYRDGQSITYQRSSFKEAGCKAYFTLQFTLQFQHDNDYITLSPYAPYSYSRLMKVIGDFQTKANENHLSWKLKPISLSLTNTEVPYISITGNSKNFNTKQNVVIIARQHSGETWSSYLVQQLIRQLVQQKTEYSKWFTDNYVLRIFPMVNVDGVIYGNFRCDLAGYDLNRTWKDTLQLVQPHISSIKAELQKLSEKNGILFCLDLHTHSKEFGAFAYCCVQSEKGREFPSLLSRITPIFRYPACTFGIAAEKQSTARSFIYNLTKNINVITVELSACGFKTKGNKQPHVFSPLYMKNIAKSLLHGYHCYSLKKEPSPIPIKIQERKPSSPVQSISLATQEEEHPVLGSDSEPQADQIQLKVRIQKIFPQTFIEDIMTHSRKKKIIKKLNKTIQPLANTNSTQQQKSSGKKSRLSPDIQPKSNKTQAKPLIFHSIDPVEDKKIVVPSSPNRKKLRIQSNSDQPLYKKPHKIYAEKSVKAQPERATKPLNLIQFSLKKLPIVPPDKIQPNMTYIMDESFPLVGGISYSHKQQPKFDKTFSTYQAICRPRVRANSRKVNQIREKNHKLQQQLPYLCVMPENKRLLHFEHIKERILEEQITQIRTFHNSILNGHKQKAMTGKLKNSQKYQNGELARMADQFTRYEEMLNTKKYK